MNLVRIPLSSLVPLLHDWLPLKQTVVLDTAFCNHFDRPVLVNILRITCKLGSAKDNILSEVVVKNRFRNTMWETKVITCNNAAQKIFKDDFMPVFKLENLEEFSFYSADICISHFLILPEKFYGGKYPNNNGTLEFHGFIQPDPHQEWRGVGVNGKYHLTYGRGTYFGEMIAYDFLDGDENDDLFWDVEGQGELFSCGQHRSNQIGEWKNGKLNGLAKSWRFDHRDNHQCDIKIGQFIDGKLTGEGTYQKSYNGFIQKGKFLNDKLIHGQIEFTDGSIYSGDIGKNVTACGQGVITRTNGDHYTGCFLENQYSGFGLMKYINGDIYSGMWKGDERRGKGELNCANGMTYIGDWSSDTFWGNGTLTLCNGDVYTGTFIRGFKQGTGEMKYANGDTYSGHWVENRHHNIGVLTRATGEMYHGGFVNGLYHGMGTLLSENGDVHIGLWCAGLRHGQGTFRNCQNRTAAIGLWDKDNLVNYEMKLY